MTIRKLEDDGDIATSGTQFVNGQTEIAQNVSSRLKLFSGEYFRNILDGTPWFSRILGKGQGVGVRDAAIKRRVLQTQNVSSVYEYDVDFDLQTRVYSVEIGIVTPFGQDIITLSDVLNG